MCEGVCEDVMVCVYEYVRMCEVCDMIPLHSLSPHLSFLSSSSDPSY